MFAWYLCARLLINYAIVPQSFFYLDKPSISLNRHSLITFSTAV
jgi:hypothetical protein